MELVIGTKAWSTWSLRPWLVLKHSGAPFTETLIPLRQENNMSEAAILGHSPSGLVPALRDGDLVIGDSLAICEYLHEALPAAKLWPDDRALRALGRAAAAEMHSGFASLRSECSMALDQAPQVMAISEATQKNVRRIVQIWRELLARSGGPYLLGDWSIADAFYAPVASRFHTYGIPLSDFGDTGEAAAYGRRLLEDPHFLAWEAAAKAGD